MPILKHIQTLRHVGVGPSAKWARDRAVAPLVPTIHKMRWSKHSSEAGYSGLSAEHHEVPLVISLTTFPARTRTVHIVIESLLMQTCKPDVLVLWLAREQYPGGEADLPESLIGLKRYGLDIRWCSDMRSYKKLIPTLREFPGAAVITADDDIYYGPHWAGKLYRAYMENPRAVHCHRVTKFYKDEGQWRTSPGGYDVYPFPTYLHKLTGGSGAIYPPAPLPPEMVDESLFMKIAPTNDDIWFWLMAARAGLPCNVVRGSEPALFYVEGSQEQALTKVNDQGERLFWKQFGAVLEKFPDAARLLDNEWCRVRAINGAGALKEE